MERCIGGVHRGVLQTTHAPRETCISYDRRVQEWGDMTRFRPRRQTSACGPAWIAFAWMQCGRGVLVHACRGMRRHPVRALLLVVGHQSENVADLLSPGYCYILQLICVDPASSARLLFRTDISFTQNVTANMLQRPRRSDRVPGCVVLDGQLPNAYTVR
jgi:hypothetical protein